jgi:hypothetical protein
VQQHLGLEHPSDQREQPPIAHALGELGGKPLVADEIKELLVKRDRLAVHADIRHSITTNRRVGWLVEEQVEDELLPSDLQRPLSPGEVEALNQERA